LIRPTKNSCNVVFAPDQGTGVLIAREFLEYPDLLNYLIDGINQCRWIVCIFLLPGTLNLLLFCLVGVVCGRHPAYLFLTSNVNQSRSGKPLGSGLTFCYSKTKSALPLVPDQVDYSISKGLYPNNSCFLVLKAPFWGQKQSHMQSALLPAP